jgi:RNA polymerase sigma factor (sigma-70 family)
MAKSTIDDTDLVRRAAAGDEGAWEELVGRKEGLVRAMARGVGLGDADVADVAQTTWLRLLSHIHRLHQVENINGWLAVTAKREAIRVSMGRSRCSAVEDTILDAHRQIDRDGRARLPEDGVLAGECRTVVRRAVRDLPARQRDIVELFLDNPDLAYEDVATIAGVPIGSLGPTRRRALDRLGAREEVLALR